MTEPDDGNVPPLAEWISSAMAKMESRYAESPIRGFLQLTPLTAAFDTALMIQADKVAKERARTFFEELAKGKIELTRELIEGEDFLHCFFGSLRAAVRSRKREKIRIFARLLRSTLEAQSLSRTDEFEDYLAILDDLSVREIAVLVTLEKYQTEFPPSDVREAPQKADAFWPKFKTESVAIYGSPEKEVDALIARLERTGLYLVFEGLYGGNPNRLGWLTPAYFRLKELIQDEQGNVLNG